MNKQCSYILVITLFNFGLINVAYSQDVGMGYQQQFANTATPKQDHFMKFNKKFKAERFSKKLNEYDFKYKARIKYLLNPVGQGIPDIDTPTLTPLSPLTGDVITIDDLCYGLTQAVECPERKNK